MVWLSVNENIPSQNRCNVNMGMLSDRSGSCGPVNGAAANARAQLRACQDPEEERDHPLIAPLPHRFMVAADAVLRSCAARCDNEVSQSVKLFV